MTLFELKARLATKDPDELLELLGITSELLVYHFEDIIEEEYDRLVEEVEDDEFSAYKEEG